MMPQYLLNGRTVPCEDVGHRDLGFGEDADFCTAQMDVVMADDAFLELMGDSYASYVEDTKGMIDEEDEDDLLSQAGHPPLGEVLRNQKLLEYLIRECLLFPFLEVVAASPKPKWIINNILSVAREGGIVKVRFGVYPNR